MPSVFDKNLLHFQRRVDEVQLHTEPYLYLKIPNAFHPDFYNFLCYIENTAYRSFSNYWQNMNEVKPSYSEGRYMVMLDSIAKKYPIVEVINNHLDKCREILDEKYQKSFTYIDRKAYFVRDTKGYKINPHTDSSNKVLTFLLYMPDENDLPLHGTDVCIPKDRNFTAAGTNRYLFSDFNVVDSAPFEKNMMFSFIRSNNSFHSSKLQEADLTRKLLMYTYYGVEKDG